MSNINVSNCSLLQVLECYIISVDSIIIPLLLAVLSAMWIMLPAYLPNPVAALMGGGTPIDFGKKLSDGKRILGEGKTYRGLLCGVLAGIAIGLIQIWLEDSYSWDFLPHHTLASIVLLSLGALLGDMGKSFLKRRLGKDRGTKWPVADQYDLVVGALVLLLLFDPSWLVANFTLPIIIIIIILTPILHRAVNIIGYISGIKEVPW
jgi:CDP-2,3-bis-(O-geranylgeranyl)-sn-glycerol synthase